MFPPDILADEDATHPFSVSWVIINNSVGHILMSIPVIGNKRLFSIHPRVLYLVVVVLGTPHHPHHPGQKLI
jgi:hypothetical protein